MSPIHRPPCPFRRENVVGSIPSQHTENAGSREELVRLALLFTQLGTTLSTLAALQALDASTAAGNAQRRT